MKKIINIFLIVWFMIILTFPIIGMNKATDQKSFFDNRMLVEFPASLSKNGYRGFLGEMRNGLEPYLLDRVAGREKMITSYQVLCDKLFNKLVHPAYMYGRNQYIFFKSNDYIRDYQNIYDEKHVILIADYIKSIQYYLNKKNIYFIYFLIPDKKSVYGEYFPSGINKANKVSRADFLIELLKKENINFVSLKDLFINIKNNVQLYNIKFDAAHWNDDGAFIGISKLLDKIKEDNDNITSLNKNDYNISIIKKSSLGVSKFKINENVPIYRLNKDNNDIYDHSISSTIKTNDKHKIFIYRNPKSNNRYRTIIFHDSYLNPYHIFFTQQFYETIFIHSNNLENISYYLTILPPDIVILENVERVLNTKNMLFDLKHLEKLTNNIKQQKEQVR